MAKRKDSTKKFTGASRLPTEEEMSGADIGWFTYDVYLENGSIEIIQETSETYEMVAGFYKMTRGDKIKISKIEQITQFK